MADAEADDFAESSREECILFVQDQFKFSFKHFQKSAITAILEGKDTFVCAPTGSGKTACYCYLPLVFDLYDRFINLDYEFNVSELNGSVILVISPLVSLMMDQVERLTSIGISAALIGEKQDDPNMRSKILQGEVAVVFASPEAVLRSRWRSMLTSDVYKEKLKAIIVDEAHCVSTWGKSFRKDYERLGELRSLVSDIVPVMALTATATEKMQNQICSTLLLNKDPVKINIPPNRPNVHYETMKVNFDFSVFQ